VAALVFCAAFVSTAGAETWELEVVAARPIIAQPSDGGRVSVLLSRMSIALFDNLIRPAKGATKQIHVDGAPVALAVYDRERGELKIKLGGINDDEARALADRLVAKVAKIEVVEAAEK
jgi:hypothetical protein